jgi:hypothetical protein
MCCHVLFVRECEAGVEGKQRNEVEGKAAGRKAGPKSGPRNALVLAHAQHSAPRHTARRLPGQQRFAHRETDLAPFWVERRDRAAEQRHYGEMARCQGLGNPWSLHLNSQIVPPLASVGNSPAHAKSEPVRPFCLLKFGVLRECFPSTYFTRAHEQSQGGQCWAQHQRAQRSTRDSTETSHIPL